MNGRARPLIIALAGLWLGLCAAGSALAQDGGGQAGSSGILVLDDAEDAPTAANGAPGRVGSDGSVSPLWLAARAALGLGLVLVLLGGMVALGRKLLPRSAGMFRSPAVEVIGRSYLDPKRSVYLLKVGGRVLVVGSSEAGLTCLSEVAEAAEVAHLCALSGNRVAAGGNGSKFGMQLRRRVARMVGLVKQGGTQVETDCDDREAITEEVGPNPAEGAVCPGAGSAEDGELGRIRERIEGLKYRLRTIS